MVQARLRNERVLLFNPLKLFRIMALTPGTSERCAKIPLSVSALISIPLCCVSQKSSISCLGMLGSVIHPGKKTTFALLRVCVCVRIISMPGSSAGTARNWFLRLKYGRCKRCQRMREVEERVLQFYQNAWRWKWERLTAQILLYSQKTYHTLLQTTKY